MCYSTLFFFFLKDEVNQWNRKHAEILQGMNWAFLSISIQFHMQVCEPVKQSTFLYISMYFLNSLNKLINWAVINFILLISLRKAFSYLE